VGNANWGWHLNPVYWQANRKQGFALGWVAAFEFALVPFDRVSAEEGVSA
jgi:hypothetical protein